MELKPCPFCGGESNVCESGISGKKWTYGLVEHKDVCFFLADGLPTKNQHIRESDFDAWNSRAEHTSEQGVLMTEEAWDRALAEIGYVKQRTCRIITTRSDSDYVNDWRYRCSECLCNIPVNERIQATGEIISAANFCPNCGAKVVES